MKLSDNPFNDVNKAIISILIEELKARFAEINTLNTQIGAIYTLTVTTIGISAAAIGLSIKTGSALSISSYLDSDINRLLSAVLSCIFMSFFVLKSSYSSRIMRQAKYIDGMLKDRLREALLLSNAPFLDYENFARNSRKNVFRRYAFIKYVTYENTIIGVPFIFTSSIAVLGAFKVRSYIELCVYVILECVGIWAWVSTGRLISAIERSDGNAPATSNEERDMYKLLLALRRRAIFRKFVTLFQLDIPYRLRELQKPLYLQLTRSSEEIVGRSYKSESEVIEKIIELIATGYFNRFIDVGANIGFYSWLVEENSRDIEIIAIEPELRNVSTMLKSAKMRDSKIILMRAALAEKSGYTQFYADDVTGKTGSISTVYDGKSYAENFFLQKRRIEFVPSIAIDDISSLISPNTLIKMDIEGGELKAIRGGIETIISKRPYFIIEINRNDKDDTLKMFDELGYNCEPISKEGFLDRDYLAVPN